MEMGKKRAKFCVRGVAEHLCVRGERLAVSIEAKGRALAAKGPTPQLLLDCTPVHSRVTPPQLLDCTPVHWHVTPLLF